MQPVFQGLHQIRVLFALDQNIYFIGITQIPGHGHTGLKTGDGRERSGAFSVARPDDGHSIN
jgi:hypothetical protein